MADRESGTRIGIMTQTNEERLWLVEDVAAYLGVTSGAIYKMTGPKAKIIIPHVRIAGRLRFRKSDIDEWLALLTVSMNQLLDRARSEAEKAWQRSPRRKS